MLATSGVRPSPAQSTPSAKWASTSGWRARATASVVLPTPGRPSAESAVVCPAQSRSDQLGQQSITTQKVWRQRGHIDVERQRVAADEKLLIWSRPIKSPPVMVTSPSMITWLAFLPTSTLRTFSPMVAEMVSPWAVSSLGKGRTSNALPAKSAATPCNAGLSGFSASAARKSSASPPGLRSVGAHQVVGDLVAVLTQGGHKVFQVNVKLDSQQTAQPVQGEGVEQGTLETVDLGAGGR